MILYLLKQSQCKEVQYARGMLIKDGLISHYKQVNENNNEYYPLLSKMGSLLNDLK